MREFRGKTAVITGAGSGIGEALARRMGAAGMSIVLADVEVDALARVAAALRAVGVATLSVETDVADPVAVDRLADAAWAAFGAVDLLCNNAGVAPAGRIRRVWEFALEDWRWTFGVNLMGLVHGLRSFVPRMLAQGTEGHILTTASLAGLLTGSSAPVYGASKHAAIRVTEALYASLREMGAPIGVTLLCPGVVNTRLDRAERNRPAGLVPDSGIAEESPEILAISDQLWRSAISSEAVAEMAFRAVQDNQLYVLTSDKFDTQIGERTEAIIERRHPVLENMLALIKRDATPE